MIKERKVRDFPGFIKNMDTGAIVNSDTSAFKEYSEKKLLVNTVLELKQELAIMRKFINSSIKE